jgi:YidC/Oxa1 family membrane protein insertase
MLYVMPAITVIIGARLPSGIIVYWLVNILFTIVQQYLTFRHHGPKPAVS